MKNIFLALAVLAFTSMFADTCLKCDNNQVKMVNEHLDSLTFQIVSDFLCTFDKSCTTNAEYSEWSNETLFKVLDKAPTIFFQVIVKEQVDKKTILNEIENPIHDFDLQKIYDKLKTTSVTAEIKTKYLNALTTAADKSGQKLKK